MMKQILQITLVTFILVSSVTFTLVSPAFADISEYPEEVIAVQIPSSLDQAIQPALYYDPGTDHPKPLLVALHTWSSHYDQGGGEVNYAEWCIEHDWVFMHPHFRGPNFQPQALGSEYVVSDIRDAVKYALENATIDHNRIYLIGASGGGHAALLMAGREPDIWAAVSAWCPIHDIQQWWHEKNLENNAYANQIEAACGGIPDTSDAVNREYRVRSPSHWLKPERTVPVQIATGLYDGRTGSVPFTHSLFAFNSLAIPGTGMTSEQIMQFYQTLSASHLGYDPWFDPLFARTVYYRAVSGRVEVTIFHGSHEILHQAGLTWLSNQVKGKPVTWSNNLESSCTSNVTR